MATVRTKSRAKKPAAAASGIAAGGLARLIVFCAVGAVLASVSLWQSAAVVLTDRNPLMAARMMRVPDAQVALWIANAIGKPESLKDNEVQRLVKRAVLKSPLNDAAVRTLAFHAEALGESERARRLARLSQEVSRRDVLDQLLLAQISARSGDSRGSVAHLSTALRTVSDNRESIFALMTPLLREERMRAQLTEVSGSDGGWLLEFLDYAVRHIPNGAVYTAEILADSKPIEAKKGYSRLGGNLLSSLAEQGEIGLVRHTYDRMRAGGRDLTATAELSRATIDPNLGWLGWRGTQQGGIGADVEAAGPRGAAAIVYASVGATKAIALRRMLLLRPGRYGLVEKRELSSGSANAQATWKLRCMSGAATGPIWSGADGALVYQASGKTTVTIPAGCDAQMLELHVDSPEGADGFEMVIRQFDLVPLG
jgi:hypothetical protein